LPVEPHPPNNCAVLFEGGAYFIQLELARQCGNNSRAGRIQGNTVYTLFFFLFVSAIPSQIKSTNQSTFPPKQP